MAISDTQKVDFLWKKTIFGVTNTGGSTKQGFEETIGSSAPLYGNLIMAEQVPVPAPLATGSIVQYYGTSNAIQMTVDPTVSGNLAWVATATQGVLSSRLDNWIPPAVDAGYLVEVYRGNPASGGVKILGGTNNFEWVFDYSAGVLRFVNSLPASVTATGTNALWLVGHRYIGATGLGGAGVNIRDVSIEYQGATITSGSYILNNFFDYEPQGGTVTIEINSVRIESSQYGISGRNLTIFIDNLPYDLDPGDIISARYAFAT